MVRIAVVEDEPTARTHLHTLLDEFEDRTGTPLSVFDYPTGDDLLDDYDFSHDIILMDIELPGINGMETAEAVRRIDTDVVIVFITNIVRYAIRGYRVDALDYVVKPITYASLHECLHRALARVRKRDSHTITVSTRTAMYRFDVSELSWVESRGHRLRYHTREGVLESTTTSLAALESALIPYGFFRTAKGYLVNLARVRRIDVGSVLVDDTAVPVSRSRRRELAQTLVDHAAGDRT